MTELKYTPLEDIPKIREELKAGFRSGKLKSLEYRKYLVLQLAYLIKDNHERIEQALASDLGRPVLESRFIETDGSVSDILHVYKNIDKWLQPEYPPFSMNFFSMKPKITRVPKGTVLVISPFNYPVWTAIPPIAGALAAGNTVLLKPSEACPAIASLLTELLPQYVPADLVRVVNGGIPETSKVLDLQWDHILFTGSGRVGKVVAAAAAKHLTPVTLELGGKSPAIIDPKCDLKTAVKRMFWGKCANAGQTCVSPDYVLVPRDFQDTLVEALKETYKEFFPPDRPASGAGNMSRMVSAQAFNRVKGLLDRTKGTIVIGGETDAETKFIAPTVVRDVGPDDSLLSEEIFGPLLPIVPVDDFDEAIAFINARDHPLALYVFSQDQALKDKVFNETQSGGFSVNETLILCGVEGLPFGGVGPSGYGAHTGIHTFHMFTHARASIDSPGWLDMILKFRYPPYTDATLKASQSFQAKLPPKPTGPPGSQKSGGWFSWFW